MKQQGQFQMKNGNKMNYENNLQHQYQINTTSYKEMKQPPPIIDIQTFIA
jgi:hypothetical protein